MALGLDSTLGLKILEQISAEIFRLISAQINGTPADMKVNPYAMALEDGKDELLNKSQGEHAMDVVESIKTDIGLLWVNGIKTDSYELAH